MDIYHGGCNLKTGAKDTDFARAFDAYMKHLAQHGAVKPWRPTRRKLGFGPRELGDFHFMVECRDLAQFDKACGHAALRRDPTESVHYGLNSLVTNLTFGLYRDYPDAIRHEGEEKF
jgi:hypothetical protein